VFATRQSLLSLSLSLTVAKRSVENVLFGALALCVKCHKVSSPSKIFLATEFLFMATILQLKVAKRRLFEKVLLEGCEVWFSAGRGMNEAENFFFSHTAWSLSTYS